MRGHHAVQLPLNQFRELAMSFLLLVVAGCGGPQRLALAGKVTVDGVPVYRGSIGFVRATGEGPSVGAGIENGIFALPAVRGLEPGEYRATVQALIRTGKMVTDPLRGPVDEILPVPLSNAAQTVVISKKNAERLSFELAAKR